MRRTLGLATALVAGIAGLTLFPGCTRSRSIDRAKVLEAENINLRQKASTMEEQMRQAHVAQDDAVAREQQLRADLVAAKQDARAAADARAQAAAARARVSSLQSDLSRSEQALSDANQRIADLRKAPPPAPRAMPRARAGGPTQIRYGGTSPEVEAMRRDLQSQLARYGVTNLNVEVRHEQDGAERVAIVLPDAFPPGKATLAYNPAAVKAVISVGKLIKSHYPQSHVLVEGHTDSDPIRKSKWGTNENLSRARAEAVQTLLTNSGIPATQVSTQGLGASRPLAMGSTKRAKSRNRRVEIFLSPRG